MKNVLFADWLQANAFWLGYVVMAILGGAIAHIQDFEKATTKWEWQKHLGCLVIAWTKAFFIAAIIYYLAQEYKLSQPLAFVTTGIFSVFATDAILWFYTLVKRIIGARAGPMPPNDKDGSNGQ